MAVMKTVREFMTRNPLTISPISKVSEAIKTMAENNIGSLIVVGNGKPRGILTERDLLTNLLDAGKVPDTTRVDEVMSSTMARVPLDASLKQAARVMISKKGRLVVFDHGKPVGIVTATDIVRELYKERSVFDPSRTVSRTVVAVTPETSVKEVVKIMSRRRLGSVIVVKDDKPFGIFTERDLLKRVLQVRKSLETPIGGLSTRKLIIAREETDGKGAAGMMASSRIKRLLLLKGDDMAGVITARDLVEAYAVS